MDMPIELKLAVLSALFFEVELCGNGMIQEVKLEEIFGTSEGFVSSEGLLSQELWKHRLI